MSSSSISPSIVFISIIFCGVESTSAYLLEGSCAFLSHDARSKRTEIAKRKHSWNAVDGQDGGNDYFRGTAYYVKAFKKEELPKAAQYYLEIQGANSSADVYLIMVWNKMLLGIAVGVAGILLLLCLIPMTLGLK